MDKNVSIALPEWIKKKVKIENSWSLNDQFLQKYESKTNDTLQGLK